MNQVNQPNSYKGIRYVECKLSDHKRSVIKSERFSAFRSDTCPRHGEQLGKEWLTEMGVIDFQMSVFVGGWHLGYWGMRIASQGKIRYFLNLEVIEDHNENAT